jgi:hypothetical protein
MNAKILVRFLLSASFGAVFGSFLAFDYSRRFLVGRDAFLADQARRFDAHASHPIHGIVWILGTAIFIVGVATIYEVAAITAERLLTRTRGRTADPSLLEGVVANPEVTK